MATGYNISLVFWTSVTEASEIIALYLLKGYVVGHDRTQLFEGMAMYALTGFFVTFSIDSGGLGVCGCWSVD